jgi:hypothetical protein
MTSGYQVVLDACVLVNAALRDTLLRLAEPPHLYLPRWSNDIILETVRTLETKLGITPAQTAHLVPSRLQRINARAGTMESDSPRQKRILGDGKYLPHATSVVRCKITTLMCG